MAAAGVLVTVRVAADCPPIPVPAGEAAVQPLEPVGDGAAERAGGEAAGMKEDGRAGRGVSAGAALSQPSAGVHGERPPPASSASPRLGPPALPSGPPLFPRVPAARLSPRPRPHRAPSCSLSWRGSVYHLSAPGSASVPPASCSPRARPEPVTLPAADDGPAAHPAAVARTPVARLPRGSAPPSGLTPWPAPP